MKMKDLYFYVKIDKRQETLLSTYILMEIPMRVLKYISILAKI